MKFRVYQLSDLFWTIFERDGLIYSCKGFGWPQPKKVVTYWIVIYGKTTTTIRTNFKK